MKTSIQHALALGLTTFLTQTAFADPSKTLAECYWTDPSGSYAITVIEKSDPPIDTEATVWKAGGFFIPVTKFQGIDAASSHSMVKDFTAFDDRSTQGQSFHLSVNNQADASGKLQGYASINAGSLHLNRVPVSCKHSN